MSKAWQAEEDTGGLGDWQAWQETVRVNKWVKLREEIFATRMAAE